jgi:hypothetical protein
MAADVTARAPAIVAAYDWGSLGHLVDVAGGNGALLASLLLRHPGLRGTVLDLPGAAQAAREKLVAARLADRGGPGHPGALRRGGRAGGRVLVVEKLATEADPRTEMDLRVLAWFGGRERDLAQLTALAGAAGLRVAAVRPAGATPVVELAAG